MRKRTYMRMVRNSVCRCRLTREMEAPMQVNRRGFLVGSGAALAVRFAPQVARPGGRRVLTLVYDKALGMMRAVERVVP